MEEQNSKQPQFATPAKTPKRVVRTYQSDLAKLSKTMDVSLDKNPTAPKEKPVEKKNKKEVVAKKPEGLVTPPKKDAVELPKENLKTEEKKHYIEEIESTETIDIMNTESFTKKDLDQIINTPPEDKPAPAKKAPVQTPLPKTLPKKDSVIITEEASAPKQDLLGSVMAWLMGGTGEASAPKIKEKKVVPPTFAKKLESVAVVPNVKPKPEVPKPEPAPAPAPKKPELPKLEPQRHPEVVLEQKEAPVRSSNPLFAPPKEAAPAMPKVSLPVQPPAPRTEFKKPSPISTYTSDARKGIKKQNDTSLSILAKQQDSKKAAPRKATAKKSSTPIIATAVVLLVLGVSAIGGAFYFANQGTAPVTTPSRVVTPVFAEDRTRVSASATPDLNDLADLLSSVAPPVGNTLTHVTFSIPGETGSEIIPFSNILLESNSVPGTLARSIYPQSMLGIYGEEKEPVLVLAVTSFERSFKSLLSWESEMPDALSPLFGDLSSTTFGTSTPPYIQEFIDEEIETTDARVLYDADGNTHLIYGFVTPNVLFITRTKEAFLDLADRIVRE